MSIYSATQYWRDLFLPDHTNNHRSRLLHHQTLIGVIGLLFLTMISFSFVKQRTVGVLGISTDISSQELLLLTNQKRQEAGIGTLQLNNQLSIAAHQKAKNMFAENYWAHNSPIGTSPWVFIKKSGYTYIYAGENLARGFTDSKDIINAWMNSESHKENMLSSNYEDIGFAIETGTLNGEETVLVVEMFGKKKSLSITQNSTPSDSLGAADTLQDDSTSQHRMIALSKNQYLINSDWLSRNLVMMILLLFISVFVLDMIIIERKKIVRLVGHNVDHIFFLGLVLIAIFLVGQGIIL